MNGPRLLSAYLEKHHLTHAGFADCAGTHRSQISRLVAGERGPSVPLALAVERATNGAVPVSSWAEDDDEPELAPPRPLRPRHA